MTTTTPVQVHRVYIKASPRAVWEAITSPDWIEKYGYRGRAEYDLRPGGAYRAYATPEMLAFGAPEVVVDGEVIEADPPHRLVQTYRLLFSPELVGEGFTRVIWELKEETGGFTRLTVTHELANAPHTAAQVGGDLPLEMGGGGWDWILSDLKTLLETGEALPG
jgi:uncharacterized protein YndB with AHSA1/START domain